jgi:hypothetical protein
LTYIDPETGKYNSYIKGGPARYDFTVTPGRAYFMWADGSGAVVY